MFGYPLRMDEVCKSIPALPFAVSLQWPTRFDLGIRARQVGPETKHAQLVNSLRIQLFCSIFFLS